MGVDEISKRTKAGGTRAALVPGAAGNVGETVTWRADVLREEASVCDVLDQSPQRWAYRSDDTRSHRRADSVDRIQSEEVLPAAVCRRCGLGPDRASACE